jgi:hypothetical protein
MDDGRVSNNANARFEEAPAKKESGRKDDPGPSGDPTPGKRKGQQQ